MDFSFRMPFVKSEIAHNNALFHDWKIKMLTIWYQKLIEAELLLSRVYIIFLAHCFSHRSIYLLCTTLWRTDLLRIQLCETLRPHHGLLSRNRHVFSRVRILSYRSATFVSSRLKRRCLQQRGVWARRSLLRLPLTMQYRIRWRLLCSNPQTWM